MIEVCGHLINPAHIAHISPVNMTKSNKAMFTIFFANVALNEKTENNFTNSPTYIKCFCDTAEAAIAERAKLK